jgi:hypothetical protein
MKKICFLVMFLAACLLTPSAASAQDQKCDGPADLCAQITDLQQKLSAQKGDENKVVAEEVKAADNKSAEKAAKLAVILKLILSVLGNWKSYFKTDKGKAWVKVITLVVGFVAFVATNIGFGIVWWQSLIVAFGGPGAILVHELAKVWPALTGKGALSPDEETPAV